MDFSNVSIDFLDVPENPVFLLISPRISAPFHRRCPLALAAGTLTGRTFRAGAPGDAVGPLGGYP